MNEAENNTQKQRVKVSKLAVASVICGIFGVMFALLVEPGDFEPEICSLLAILFILVGIVVGIVGIHKIRKSKALISGVALARTGVVLCVISLLYLFLLFVSARRGPHPSWIWCQNDIRILGYALEYYAQEHDGKLPEADKWCDILVFDMDAALGNFICTSLDTWDGESSYALNKYVVMKQWSQIPEDMVLLFETDYGMTDSDRDTKLKTRLFFEKFGPASFDGEQQVYKVRWNQVGGPELFSESHPNKGGAVLLKSGRVQFVKKKEIGNLKWKDEDK